jgi:aconitate hydratase
VLQIAPGDRIEIDAAPEGLRPRCEIGVRLHRANGDLQMFSAVAAVETQLETELLKHGGVIPYILHRTIAGQRRS